MSVDNWKESFKQYKELIKAFADPCKGIIYHYTSAEGLRGIIGNHEIWLTNTEFVNDKTECKALQEEKGLFAEDNFSSIYLKNAFMSNPAKNNKSYYIASFSRVTNMLEQWRAYGNFCIGFEAKRLVKRNFNLYECVYSKDEIKEWILKKGKVSEWNGDYLQDTLKNGAALNLEHAASVKFKNPNYRNEKEVRLIAISNHKWGYPKSPGMYESDPPIHFREHALYKMPVPYVKFFIEKKEEKRKQIKRREETAIQMKQRKLEEEKNKRRELLPIKEVLIGPMAYQEEAKIACEILLCEKGYENVQVTASDIPYRGF